MPISRFASKYPMMTIQSVEVRGIHLRRAGVREIGENCEVSHKPTREARADAPRERSRKNCLRSQFSSSQIVLRRHAEGIRHPIEEGEHRGDIDSLGDLVFGPT